MVRQSHLLPTINIILFVGLLFSARFRHSTHYDVNVAFDSSFSLEERWALSINAPAAWISIAATSLDRRMGDQFLFVSTGILLVPLWYYIGGWIDRRSSTGRKVVAGALSLRTKSISIVIALVGGLVMSVGVMHMLDAPRSIVRADEIVFFVLWPIMLLLVVGRCIFSKEC